MSLSVVVTFAISLGLQPLVIHLLAGRRVLDTPNERSSHVVPTPRGGGVAVVAAILVGLALTGSLSESIGTAVGVALLSMAVLGFVEDVRGVPAVARLAVQFALALVTTAIAGVPVMWLALATLFLVGYVNAFNFMDGVNGISGLNAAASGLVYACLASAQGSTVATSIGLVLAAAALGFLPWNMPRARVFLGDVGSYAIGGAIAALGLGLLLLEVPWVLVVAPLSLYLADTGSTLVRRATSGEPLLEAHRNHTYQRLTDLGFSHSGVAATTASLAVFASLTSWGLMRATGWQLAALVPMIVVTSAYLSLPVLLGRKNRASAPAPGPEEPS